MARIRTVKPEFFRHETLQDLEVANPGSYVMLLFEGLWTQCDKNGVFEWRPRQLKLDILPFIEYDIVASLLLLREAQMISLMQHGEALYGFIPTFKAHQRISGKESQDASKYPDIKQMTEITSGYPCGKQQGSNREATGSTGREGKGTGKDIITPLPPFGGEDESIEQEPPSTPPPPDNCPCEQIVILYHDTLPAFPRVRCISESIRKGVRARWREDRARQNLPWWRAFFEEIGKSDFLSGRKTDFQATLDWIVGPKNFSKILNGQYESRTAKEQQTESAADRYREMGLIQ